MPSRLRGQQATASNKAKCSRGHVWAIWAGDAAIPTPSVPVWNPVNDMPNARALAEGGTCAATMLLIEGRATPSPKPCTPAAHQSHISSHVLDDVSGCSAAGSCRVLHTGPLSNQRLCCATPCNASLAGGCPLLLLLLPSELQQHNLGLVPLTTHILASSTAGRAKSAALTGSDSAAGSSREAALNHATPAGAHASPRASVSTL